MQIKLNNCDSVNSNIKLTILNEKLSINEFNGLESEISMKKWKNNGFDKKFISSCQIQAEISSNHHIFQNFQISKASALKNPGSGPLNKTSSPGHEKARHMPCSLKVSTLAKDDIEASSWK